MLRQIEWRIQNGPTIKSGFLPVTTLFFLENFVSVLAPLKKFDLPVTQMSIFVFFVSAEV